MPISTFWKRWTGQPQDTPPASAQPEPTPSHRQQRSSRRERLLSLVREYMTQQGFGATTYKFKVLTLDNAGDSFIVMIDVQPGILAPLDHAMKQHETALQALALSRDGIVIKNVYWRLQDGAASAVTQVKAAAPADAPTPQPFDLPDAPPLPRWANQDFEATRPMQRDDSHEDRTNRG